MNDTEKKYFLIYTALYLVAFLPLVFVTGYFQDDWVWYGQADGLERWRQIGRPYNDIVMDITHALSGDLSASRFFSFFCYFLIGPLVYKILRHENLPSASSFWVALLTALAPLNFARVTGCITQYVVSFLFFILGILVLQKYLTHRNWPLRALALLIFFFSFVTNSFLVLFLLPLLLIYKYDPKPLKYLDFIFLAPLFYGLNKVLFPPYGEYANYNVINFERLLKAPIALAKSPLKLIQDLLWVPGHGYGLFLLLFFALLGVFYLLWRRGLDLNVAKTHWRHWLMSIGLVLVAIFPYAVVQRMPRNYDWDSRHYLSTHVIVGLFVFTLVGLIRSEKWRISLLAIITSLFVAKNSVVYFEFLKDGHIQNSLIAKIKKSSSIRNHSALIYNEMKRPHRTLKRVWRHYELSHMHWMAYDEPTRLAMNASRKQVKDDHSSLLERLAWLHKMRSPTPGYGHSMYQPNGRYLFVDILPGSKNMGFLDTLRITWNQLTDDEAYWQELPDFLMLNTTEFSIP